MFCIYTETMAQDETVHASFSAFYLCLRLTSPNFTFMRRRLYSKRKVKEYVTFLDNTVHQFVSFNKFSIILFSIPW